MGTVPTKLVGTASRGFFYWIKFGLFSVFVTYLLINAVMIGVREKSLEVAVIELGKQFMKPLQEANESINSIQTTGNVGFFTTIWNYWGIYYNLYKIYIILWVVMKLIINPFTKDAVPIFGRVLLTLLIFYLINMMFALLTKLPISSPFTATWDIIKVIPSIFPYSGLETESAPLVHCNNETVCGI